jgi:hypothetical protein
MEPFAAPRSGAPDLIVREPALAELDRVLYLFHKVPSSPDTRLLAAVRSRPVERFVAAVAWWPAGEVARFQLASQAGANRSVVAGLLIERLAQVAQQAGLQSMEYSDLLPADHEWAEVLRGQGFGRGRSERYFEVPFPNIWTRVTQLYRRYRPEMPAGWRTDSIRQHPPEAILGLIAPHRLLPPEEVRQAWQPAARMGFDLDRSCILFDRERAFGAFLARSFGDLLYVDVQVIHEPNPRLRSLGDICMLYHNYPYLPKEGPIHRVQFRSGETEHRQTANLALRMGGRELPPRHVFSRGLAAG